MSELVTTNWLFNNLENKNLVILDCSYFLKGEKRDPKNEYNHKHIKNAYFFDIDRISNKNNSLPHMIPNKKIFQKETMKFGIHTSSILVLYDTKGIFSSPRVWWMFKYFGHKNVCILNGGLKKWIKEKKPISEERTTLKKSTYKFKISKEWLINYKKILNINSLNSTLILDARSKERFSGLIKETRRNLKSGHIPNSKSFYWGNLINKNGEFISKSNMIKKFQKFKIRKKEIITSCGSGITACILSFGLFYSLRVKSYVYDGSWCEWGSKKGLPIEK